MHICIAIVKEEDPRAAEGKSREQQAHMQEESWVYADESPISGREGAEVMLQGSQGRHALPAGLTHPPHLNPH